MSVWLSDLERDIYSGSLFYLSPVTRILTDIVII